MAKLREALGEATANDPYAGRAATVLLMSVAVVYSDEYPSVWFGSGSEYVYTQVP